MNRILWRVAHSLIWQKGYLQHFYAFFILFFILGMITAILLSPQYQQLNQVSKQLVQIEKQIVDTMEQLKTSKYQPYSAPIQLPLQPVELNEQLWMKLLNKLSPDEFILLSLMTTNNNSGISQIELHLDYALLIEFFLSLYSATPQIYFHSLKMHSLEHPRHVYLYATFSNIDIKEEQ